METEKEPELVEMMGCLCRIKEEEAGRYALSRDILFRRIPEEKKPEMVENSIRCGREYAARIERKTGTDDPEKAAACYGLRVKSAGGTGKSGDSQKSSSPRRILFARFTPPDSIEIMEEPLLKYREVLSGLSEETGSLLPSPAEVRRLLTAHELFHFAEDRDSAKIYTRTEKIRLWGFLGMEARSPVRALGEIAAAAFARALCRTDYTPFALDVLLFYGYDKETARRIFRKMTGMKSGYGGGGYREKNGTGRFTL